MRALSKKKRIRLTSIIAQVMLVMLILPVIALVMFIVNGSGQDKAFTDFVFELIEEVPLGGVWAKIIYQMNGGMSAADLAEMSVLVALQELPETMIAALFCYICEKLSSAFLRADTPVLSALVGIGLATVLNRLLGQTGSDLTQFLIEIGLVVILILAIRFMLKGLIKTKRILSTKKILEFIIDGLFAVISTAYVTVLLLTAAGGFSTTGAAAKNIWTISGAELAAGLIYLVVKILLLEEDRKESDTYY